MTLRAIARVGLAVAALLALSPARAGAQAAATDSVLAAACADGGGLAYGLLMVLFAQDVSADRRQAVARDAGGTLAGPAEGGPGAYYVTLPAGARSDLAADRIIRQEGVESVGDVVCPPPPAPAAASADTTAAADTTPPADTSSRQSALPADTTARPADSIPADTTARTDSAAAGPPAPAPQGRVIR